jgi:hypothetical protein
VKLGDYNEIRGLEREVPFNLLVNAPFAMIRREQPLHVLAFARLNLLIGAKIKVLDCVDEKVRPDVSLHVFCRRIDDAAESGLSSRTKDSNSRRSSGVTQFRAYHPIMKI